jgi:hypothetical protein
MYNKKQSGKNNREKTIGCSIRYFVDTQPSIQGISSYAGSDIACYGGCEAWRRDFSTKYVGADKLGFASYH